MRMYQNFERQNRGEYRGNYRNENYKRERGITEKEVGEGLENDHFLGILVTGEMTDA